MFSSTSGFKASLFNRAIRQVLFGIQETNEYALRLVTDEEAARVANDASTLVAAKAYSDSLANKASVGLGNVDNTSDMNKPVSTAQANAIASGDSDTLSAANAYTDNKANKTAVGLGNVDNTSDVNKPISTATQNALNLKASTSSLGTAAFVNSNTFATAAQGGLAQTAIQTLVEGTNIIIDSTDPKNPVITATLGTGAGSGDVVGPAAAGNNEIAIYNGTTGRAIKANTGITADSTGINLPSGAKYKINGANLTFNDIANNPWNVNGTIVQTNSGYDTVQIVNGNNGDGYGSSLSFYGTRGIAYIAALNDTGGTTYSYMFLPVSGTCSGTQFWTNKITLLNQAGNVTYFTADNTGVNLLSGETYKINGTQLGYGNGLTGFGTGATYSTGTTANTIPVLDASGTLPASIGGTGISSFAIGDILVANSTSTFTKVSSIAGGNVLRSGGVGAAPSYGKVGLTTHVSGTLPIGNGRNRCNCLGHKC